MADLNWLGICLETVAAELESDAALAEWLADNPASKGFPPESHYFWAAWAAELALKVEDDFAQNNKCSH